MVETKTELEVAMKLVRTKSEGTFIAQENSVHTTAARTVAKVIPEILKKCFLVQTPLTNFEVRLKPA